MKKISIIILLASIIFLSACKGDSKKQTDNVEDKVSETVKTAFALEDGMYNITNGKSSVAWTAEGVGHGHNGQIKISSGAVIIKNGEIADGKLSIDMNSIYVEDIKDAKENKKLVDHLIGEDFFDVAKFPTASVQVLGSSEDILKVKLTIKGQSQDVKIPFKVLTVNDVPTLLSNFSIDRTKFGVKYNSKNFFKNLGDYMIEDEINFSLSLGLEKN